MKIGIASYSAGAGGHDTPEGVIEIRRYSKFAIIDLERGAVVDNVTAFMWGPGEAINGVLPETAPGDDVDIIRSWANASERDGHKLFDQELEPDTDYLLLAIPCAGAVQCEGLKEGTDE